MREVVGGKESEGSSVGVVGRMVEYDAEAQAGALVDPDDDGMVHARVVLHLHDHGQNAADEEEEHRTRPSVTVSLRNMRSQFFHSSEALVLVSGEMERGGVLRARTVLPLDEADYELLQAEMRERRAWFARHHPGVDV